MLPENNEYNPPTKAEYPSSSYSEELSVPESIEPEAKRRPSTRAALAAPVVAPGMKGCIFCGKERRQQPGRKNCSPVHKQV